MTQEELLFFDGHPGALAAYDAVRRAVLTLAPQASVQVKKTQIGFGAPLLCVIAWLPRRKRDGDRLQVSLCLPERLCSPRVQLAVEPYPGRYMHHLLLDALADVDEELIGWMARAVAFAKR